MDIYIRLDSWLAGLLPRTARSELRMVAWDASSVFVAALLVRLEDEERLTFETWIDAGTEIGRNILKHYAQPSPRCIYIVTDRIERRYPTDNTVSEIAMKLYREAMSRTDVWTKERYDELFRMIARRYPASRHLWNASVDESIYTLV